MWLFDIVFFHSTWSLQVIVHFNILFLRFILAMNVLTGGHFVSSILLVSLKVLWAILYMFFVDIDFLFFSFLYSRCPGVPLLGHMVNIVCFRNSQTVFQRHSSVFHSLHFSTSWSVCASVIICFYLVILSGMEWYLIVLVICISLMDQMLNTFMFLLVISVSSLVHCLCLLFIFNWIS